MVYVGVDLHRKRSQVAVLDGDGALVLDRQIPIRAAHFQRIFGELEPEALSVVFEAT